MRPIKTDKCLRMEQREVCARRRHVDGDGEEGKAPIGSSVIMASEAKQTKKLRRGRATRIDVLRTTSSHVEDMKSQVASLKALLIEADSWGDI